MGRGRFVVGVVVVVTFIGRSLLLARKGDTGEAIGDGIGWSVVDELAGGVEEVEHAEDFGLDGVGFISFGAKFFVDVGPMCFLARF